MTNLLLLISFLSVTALEIDAGFQGLHKRRLGLQSPPMLAEIQGLEKIARTNSGVFTRIQGDLISTLVADADPCLRYPLIDEIVTICRTHNCLKEGVEIANRVAALEKNTNTFIPEKTPPSFCNNSSLPASPEVRCVLPLIDPAFPGAAEFNAKVTSRLNQIQSTSGGNAQLCAGQSIQQQAIALGFSGCRGCNITPGSNTAPIATPSPAPQSPPATSNNAATPAPVPQGTPATNNDKVAQSPNAPANSGNALVNTGGQCVSGSPDSAAVLQMMNGLNGLIREIESMQNLLRNSNL